MPNFSFTVKSGAFYKRVASLLISISFLFVGFISVAQPAQAYANPTPVDLGRATSFAALGSDLTVGAGVNLNGRDYGSSPAIAALYPSGVLRPTADSANALTDLSVAIDAINALISDAPITGNLNGQTFTPGIYYADAAVSISAGGIVTLDGGGNPEATFIFNVNAAINVGERAQVILVNGAKSRNVFWKSVAAISVSSSSSLSGIYMSTAAITVGADSQANSSFLSLAAVTIGAAAGVTPIVYATISDAPTSVVAVPGNSSATVSWDRPAYDGDTAITNYTVISNPAGGILTTLGTATSGNMTGLTNGTPYTFMVTATNNVGTSVASAPSIAVTPRTLPGAPKDVIAVLGNGQANVSWTAPDNDGGSAIIGYTITSSVGHNSTVVSATTGVVTGLINGTAYTFTVVAINAAGTSVASTPSSFVTPRTVPDAPTGVAAAAGNAQATITWAAPASDGGSAITSYTVTSSPAGGTLTTAGATTGVVTGLINGTAYTFTVVAINAAGTSVASDVFTAVIPVAPEIIPPPPPNGVSSIRAYVRNGRAVVMWRAPVGVVVTGYIVTTTPTTPAFTETSTPRRSVIIKGLTKGVTYTFAVKGVTSSGGFTETLTLTSVAK